MGDATACLSDFSPCNGFSTGTGAFQRYVGMFDNDVNEGGLSACGCNIACYPCDDARLVSMFAIRDGFRWLRPSQTLYNQDSTGRLRAAESNPEYPHRIPQTTAFDRAPCWDAFGFECYGGGLCDCDNPPSCTGNIPGPCYGHFYDAWWYRGYLWTPGIEASHIKCRQTHEIGPLPIGAFAGRLYQAAFIRASAPRYSNQGLNYKQCVSNKLILCTAYIDRSTSCPSAFDVQQPTQETYNPPAALGQYHYMGLVWNGVRLKDQGQYSSCTGVPLAIKNAALEVIPQHFDAVEHKTYSMGVPGNAYLDTWERKWSASNCQGHVLASFPNSYLRFSRCPVRVVFELVNASVSFSLVAHSIIEGTTNTENYESIWPTARVRVHGTIAMRAYLDEHRCFLNGQQIVIDNHNEDESDCPNSATVVGGLDEIVVVDSEGRTFDPPSSVEWWGYHGRSGVSHWENRLFNLLNLNIQVQCCQVGWALSGLQIHGWPTAIESRGQSQANSLYDGHVTTDFANQGTFTAVCGQPPDDGGGGAGTPVDRDFRPSGDTFGPSGPFGPADREQRPEAPEPPYNPFDPTRPPVGRGPFGPIGGPEIPPSFPRPRPPIDTPGPFTPADREPPRDFPPFPDNPFDPTNPPIGQQPPITGPMPRLRPPNIKPVRPMPIGRAPFVPNPHQPQPPNDNPPSPHDPIRGGSFPFGPGGPVGPGPDRNTQKQ